MNRRVKSLLFIIILLFGYAPSNKAVEPVTVATFVATYGPAIAEGVVATGAAVAKVGAAVSAYFAASEAWRYFRGRLLLKKASVCTRCGHTIQSAQGIATGNAVLSMKSVPQASVVPQSTDTVYGFDGVVRPSTMTRAQAQSILSNRGASLDGPTPLQCEAMQVLNAGKPEAPLPAELMRAAAMQPAAPVVTPTVSVAPTPPLAAPAPPVQVSVPTPVIIPKPVAPTPVITPTINPMQPITVPVVPASVRLQPMPSVPPVPRPSVAAAPSTVAHNLVHTPQTINMMSHPALLGGHVPANNKASLDALRLPTPNKTANMQFNGAQNQQNPPKQQPNDPLKTPQEDPNKPQKDKESKLATLTSGVKSAKESNKIEWTNHGWKHKPQQNVPWKKIVENTRDRKFPAKYKPGIEIEQLEKTVWDRGVSCKSPDGQVWKAMKFENIVGASNGQETNCVVVKNHSNMIHGHPITAEQFLQWTKL
jgi:hypothetical protein